MFKNYIFFFLELLVRNQFLSSTRSRLNMIHFFFAYYKLSLLLPCCLVCQILTAIARAALWRTIFSGHSECANWECEQVPVLLLFLIPWCTAFMETAYK